MKIMVSVFVTVLLIIVLVGESGAICMRCNAKGYGSDLLCEGENKFDATQKCGEPDYTEESGTETSGDFGRGSFEEASKIVEKWYYNCGGGSFNKILTFKGGILFSIEDSKNKGSGPEKCW